jgi:ubiquinone/menaquinone biosynthesis C-methylase UbiE
MNEFDFLDFEADFSAARFVDTYDELPLWSAMFGLLLLDELPLAQVRDALDVGCGTGFPLIELAERLGPASRVHGIDPWSAALRRAATKIASRGTPNVTLHEGSATAMPFPDESFDLIVSNLGINNFDDRLATIRECGRLARSGATIGVTTNLQGHMQELYAVFHAILTEQRDDPALERLRAHVEHRATISAVKELLEQGGFTVTRVIERQAQMRFANGTALLNHHFIKLGFLDGWKTIVPGKERAFFAALRLRLDALAEKQGALALTIPMAYIEGRKVPR